MAVGRLCGLVLLAGLGFAHGGAFLGPADPVAPGVGVRAAVPAPSGPVAPGVPASSSGGPVVKFVPPDHSTWDLWWAFHREGLVERDFSGLTPHQRARALSAMSVLLGVEEDRTRAAALIAFAKCGGDAEEILPHLAGESMVAEAATVALGIAGDAKSLLALHRGTEAAREWVDGEFVPARVHGFAILGLGRPGVLSEGREAFLNSLLPYLTGDIDAADDVVAASALVMGRVRLPDGGRSEDGTLRFRGDQVAWLLKTLEEPAIPWIARAHLLTSLALLVEGESERVAAIELFMGRLARAGRKPPFESLGCVLALGHLLDAEGGEVDKSGSQALVDHARGGHRDLAGPAWVSIGRVAARIESEGGLDTFEEQLGESPSKEGALGDWAQLAHAIVGTGTTHQHESRRPGEPNSRESLSSVQAAATELLYSLEAHDVDEWLTLFDGCIHGRERAHALQAMPLTGELLDRLLDRTRDAAARPYAVAAIGRLAAPSPSEPYSVLFHHRAATPVLVGDGRGLFDLF